MAIAGFSKLNITDPLGAEALNRVQDNIIKMFDSIRNELRPKWIDVGSPLANGWSVLTYAGVAGSVNGGPISVSYLRDVSGFVWLRGLVTGGTKASGATGTVFTLPAGYRPFYQMNFVTADPTTVVIALDNGDVRVASSTNAYASLNGVSFFAEQ